MYNRLHEEQEARQDIAREMLLSLQRLEKRFDEFARVFLNSKFQYGKPERSLEATRVKFGRLARANITRRFLTTRSNSVCLACALNDMSYWGNSR